MRSSQAKLSKAIRRDLEAIESPSVVVAPAITVMDASRMSALGGKRTFAWLSISASGPPTLSGYLRFSS
jgi:hypothetical protein